MRTFRWFSVLSVVAAATLSWAVPARADVPIGSLAITGSGTLSPGIPGPTGTSAVPNRWIWAGTATGVLGTAVGSCAISFNGDGNDTFLTGLGSGSVSCNGAGISLSCSPIFWNRVGLEMTTTGSCTGTVTGTLRMAVHLNPANVNPWTSYTLAGTATLSAL